MLRSEEPVRFTCLPTCWGRCCTKMDLPLFPWDVVTLARGLELSTGDVLARHALVTMDPETRWPSVKLRAIRMGPCTFLDPETRTCTIYPFRPDVCRLYPLAREWPAAGDDFIYRWSDTPRCPQGATAPGCAERTVPQWLERETDHPAATDALRDYFRLQRRALVQYRCRDWAGPEVVRALSGLLFDQDGVRQRSGIGPEVPDAELHRRCMAAAHLFLRHLARGAGCWRGDAPQSLELELPAVLRGERA